ncbi:MAG: arylmalonate decarboxylase [Alphaproteobacteria bacterium]|nr:arylmalonate decarboxylase [Alphaproteobacteria bacterium]
MTDIRFDEGPYPRARLGFICVANAGLTEGEMFAMRPEGVGLSFTHMRMRTECTVENLAQMEHDLDDALQAFLPGRDDMDVICYNCTSGSFVIGEDIIRSKIEQGRDGVTGTTLLTGVVAAFRALGAQRISIGTAYTSDIDALERAYFCAQGFEICAIRGLGLVTDTEMNKVSPRYLAEFARSLDRPEAEAIFLSCGALRSLEIVEEVERATGKPVVCSNQASFWHCLRLAGVSDRIEGFGRLIREH